MVMVPVAEVTHVTMSFMVRVLVAGGTHAGIPTIDNKMLHKWIYLSLAKDVNFGLHYFGPNDKY